MLSDAKDHLAKILGSCDYDQFFEEIVGQKVLSLSDENASDRKNMLGSDPRREILTGFEQYAPSLTCHAHNPAGPPPEARSVRSAEEFQTLVDEYHGRGYTVRIPEVTAIAPSLQQFTRSLEIILSSPVDAAIFWSAEGAAAPVHHDEYDIIAIQLVGKKKWIISSDPPTLPNKWARIGETPPTLENFQLYDVAPGDFLYLPRGTPHTVQSTTESIHLSIGFVPVTVRDAVLAVLDQYSDLNKPLRQTVTDRADNLAQGRGGKATANQVRESLDQLREQCQSDAFVEDAMDLRQSRMVVDLPKLPNVYAEKSIGLETRLRHSPFAIAHLAISSKYVDFGQPGAHILVHRGAEDSLRYIAENREFAVSDIEGDVDDDVRIALAERLLASGFLEADDCFGRNSEKPPKAALDTLADSP